MNVQQAAKRIDQFNRFNESDVSVYDVLKETRAKLPRGFQIVMICEGASAPVGGVYVGSYRVRAGDSPFLYYVVKND